MVGTRGISPLFLALLVVVSPGEGRGVCDGDEDLHHSIASVDSSFWQTHAEVDLRTQPVKNRSAVLRISPSAPSRDGQFPFVVDEGAMRVEYMIREGSNYTCSYEGQQVTLYTGHGTISCRANEILTPAKRSALQQAVQNVLDTVSEMLTPLKTTEEDGLVRLDGNVAKCGMRLADELFAFAYPSEGVEADFVLFVTASPIRRNITDYLGNLTTASAHAFGWPCHFAAHTHRPVVGLVNVDPSRITSISAEYTESVIMHEVIHALGWHPSVFAPIDGHHYEKTHATSWTKLSNADAWYAEKARYEALFRVVSRPTASERVDFAAEGASSVPVGVTVAVGDHVLAVAAAFYNCSDLRGVEVEDHTFGTAPPPFYSVNWEKRILDGEVMNARVSIGAKLTQFTLAMLADTGFYNVSFSKAADYHYGRMTGCALHSSPCGEWHSSGSSEVRRYSCIQEFRHGCAFEGTPCLRGCLPYQNPGTSSALCTGRTAEREGSVPLQYIGETTVFASIEEAMSYRGCDALMDHCFVWREVESACLSLEVAYSKAPARVFGSPADETAAQGQAGADCWSGKCSNFAVFGPASRCYAGDLRQRSVAATGAAAGAAQSGHCLPTECFTTIFGTAALHVTLGSSTVVCHSEGAAVGPGSTRAPGEFFTFSPEEVSGLVGLITCPDPAAICSQTAVLPPVSPPLYLAPYYQDEGGPPAPADAERPNAVHVTRVLVNGIDPCTGSDSAARCVVPGWTDTNVTISVYGGPFTPAVIANLWIGFARDPACSVDMRLIPLSMVHGQTLVYVDLLPSWMQGDTLAYLCVRLNDSYSLKIAHTPPVAFKHVARGTLSTWAASPTGLRIEPPAVAPLGLDLTFTMENWSADGPLVYYYSFVSVAASGKPLLLSKGMAQQPAAASSMLPKGVNEVRGSVHLFDGTRMSTVFTTASATVEVSGFDAPKSADDMAAILRKAEDEAAEIIGVTSNDAILLASFGVVENLAVLVGEVDKHLAAGRPAFRVLAADAEVLEELGKVERDVVAGASLLAAVLVSGITAEVSAAVVSSASSALLELSLLRERCGYRAQVSCLEAVDELLVRVQNTAAQDGELVVDISLVDGVLDVIDNVVKAAEAEALATNSDSLLRDINARVVKGILRARSAGAAYVRHYQQKVDGVLEQAHSTSTASDFSYTQHRQYFSLAGASSNTAEVLRVRFAETAALDGSSTTAVAEMDSALFRAEGDVDLASKVIDVSVTDSNGRELTHFPEATVTFDVDSSLVAAPPLSSCVCKSEEAAGCPSVRVSTFVVKVQDPETGLWASPTPSAPSNADSTWYCENLAASASQGQGTADYFDKAIQLAEFGLQGTSGAVLRAPADFSLANPDGSSPASVRKAADDDSSTSWVDFNMQPLYVELSGPPRVLSAYALTPASTHQFRDPMRWVLEGKNGTVDSLTEEDAASNGTGQWRLLDAMAKDCRFTGSGNRTQWFDVAQTGRIAVSLLRWTVTKQKQNDLSTVIDRPARLAAFVVTEDVRPVHDYSVSAASWSEALFSDTTPEARRLRYGLLIVYCILLGVYALCAVVDRVMDRRRGKPISLALGCFTQKRRAVPLILPSTNKQKKQRATSVRPTRWGDLERKRLSSVPKRKPNDGATNDNLEPTSPADAILNAPATPEAVPVASSPNRALNALNAPPALTPTHNPLAKAVAPLLVAHAHPPLDHSMLAGPPAAGSLPTTLFQRAAGPMKRHLWFSFLWRPACHPYRRTHRLLSLSAFLAIDLGVSAAAFGRQHELPASFPAIAGLAAAAGVASVASFAAAAALRQLWTGGSAEREPLRGGSGGVLTVELREAAHLPARESPPQPLNTCCEVEFAGEKLVTDVAFWAARPAWTNSTRSFAAPRELGDESVAVRVLAVDSSKSERGAVIASLAVSVSPLRDRAVSDGTRLSAHDDQWRALSVHAGEGVAAPFQKVPALRLILHYTTEGAEGRPSQGGRRPSAGRGASAASRTAGSCQSSSGPGALPLVAVDDDLDDAAREGADGAAESLPHPHGYTVHRSKAGSTAEQGGGDVGGDDGVRGSGRGSGSTGSAGRGGGQPELGDFSPVVGGGGRGAAKLPSGRRLAKTLAGVLTLHAAAYGLTWSYLRFSNVWIPHLLSLVVHWAACPFLQPAIIFISAVSVLLVSSLAFAHALTGAVVALTILLLAIMGAAGDLHYIIRPTCYTVFLSGLQAYVLSLSLELDWGLLLVFGFINAAIALPCYFVCVDVLDTPYRGLVTFSVLNTLSMYVFVNHLDAEGKEISAVAGWALPLLSLVFQLACYAASYRVARGPLPMPVCRSYGAHVANLAVLIVHIVVICWAIVRLSGHENSRAVAVVVNATLWTCWQDIFINEPLILISVEYAVVLSYAVLRSPLGGFVRSVLRILGIHQLA
ncbi:Leishmanolysin-like peptidase [Diplonema papillatum]|nr:Leishmanolysin-like peptidase [Diplonema papillatum]